MIRLLTDHISPRLSYIADLVFREMMGTGVLVQTGAAATDTPEEPVIHYRRSSTGEGIHIVPSGLLEEKGIGTQPAEPHVFDGIPCLFPVEGSNDWPCDPLATSFYLVSRYEEYLRFEADQHGRFPASQSIASRHGFLEEPVVNLIVDKLRQQIRERWPGYEMPTPRFSFIPTFDVDIAYAHLEKEWSRTVGGSVKLMLAGKPQEVRERFLTLRGKKSDPFDNFHMQSEVLDEYGKKGLYFFLLGDYGPYDKNINHHSEKFRDLIRDIDKKYEACLHPSYASADDPEMLTEEIGRLRKIVNRPVVKSRQHFLRLRFPYSYRELLRNGITDDYSMGYADSCGFRAGIAFPFYFYDLMEESVTNLRVHPFMFMDTAMIDRLQLTPGEAREKCLLLAGKVQNSGGVSMGVWHNYALSNKEQYRGWTETFRQIVGDISKMEKR